MAITCISNIAMDNMASEYFTSTIYTVKNEIKMKKSSSAPVLTRHSYF